jgi:uncharacterized ferritin-like protein (DUF455 family)
MDTRSIGFIRARGGVTLRASPAREPCFNVVNDQAQMHKSVEGSLEHRRELLHSSVNEEIQSIEIAAQCLADFPDEPWDIRLCLARQCWDEARHAQVCFLRLLELGGRKGEFPVINQEWGVVCTFDSLAARLAIQNRIFEGGSLDVLKESAQVWAKWGDPITSDILDAIAADEVQHSRFANQWFARLPAEDPRKVLQAIAAVSTLKTWAKALTPPEQEMEHIIPVNEEDRRHAAF